MRYGLLMNLQMFADGDGSGGNNGSNTGNNSGGITYSFEQAEQIANERAGRAERSALTNYFRQNGMTEEQAQEAFRDFKMKQEANKPNISAIEKERDDAMAELSTMKNKSILASLSANTEFEDFLLDKISKNVTDKKDFKTCAEEFLKDNPQYTNVHRQSYRMSSGSSGNAAGNSGGNTNDAFNSVIRKAFGR